MWKWNFDLSIFSFHPVKHIACGEGGMITNNKEFKDRLLNLRSHGDSKPKLRIFDDKPWYYEMQELDLIIDSPIFKQVLE